MPAENGLPTNSGEYRLIGSRDCVLSLPFGHRACRSLQWLETSADSTSVIRLAAAVSLCSLLVSLPAAGQPPLSSLLPLPDAVRDNLRLALDFSTRPAWSDARDEFFYLHAIGIDLHKVVSSPTRDWGTLIVQTYLTRIDNVSPPPPPFDDPHDWELIYRILNFNLALRRDGSLNLRAGHFELPFGLEHVVNTNGTLRDYLSPRNLGLKADWGASVNGVLSAFEYEVGLTRGSGNRYRKRGDPWLVSGRIGTPRHRRLALGISALGGEPRAGAGTQRRWRTAVDLRTGLGPFGAMLEAGLGQDGSRDISNSLLEFNWTNSSESWLVYTQFRFQVMDTPRRSADHDTAAALGVRFAPDAHWALSAEWSQGLSTLRGQSRNSVVRAQLRYRL